MPFIVGDLAWLVGSGVQVFIGIDPIVVLLDNATLSKELIHHLHYKDINFNKNMVKESRTIGWRWINARYLHLTGEWAMELENHITSLSLARFHLLDINDHIVWCRT